MCYQKPFQRLAGLVVLLILVGCGGQAPAASITSAPSSTPIPPTEAAASTPIPPTEAATSTPVSPTAAASPTVEAPAAATSEVLTDATSTSSPSASSSWILVAVGDSIPYNSPQDCPGCTGFVKRYAAAVSEASGHPVNVIRNMSAHNNMNVEALLRHLEIDANGRRKALASADIIIVGVAHYDTPWHRDDDPCDGPNGDNPDWSKYNATCAAAAAEMFRPKFESLYAQIVALRAGKPTIFRTINAYNDWIGWRDAPPEATEATRLVFDAWNAMICEAAQANGFACADIYHAFNGLDGLMPAGDLLAENYTHPSDKGNEVITRVLADLGYAPLVP